MNKLQVLWKAHKPQYIGCGDDIETLHCSGVEVFEGDFSKIYHDFMQWDEDNQVSYGEEAGRFEVLGAFWGEFEELMSGRQTFMTGVEIFQIAQRNIEWEKEVER